jgi:hypothetical protein
VTATEFVTLATAVVVLLSAMTTWRTRRQVKEVHVLVNSRMAEMVTRVNDLTAALTASDTPVPPARERDDQGEH